MSNPYGGPPGPPADREPGEPSSPYTPYGSPYSGNPYGAPAAGPGLDPVSITGFVLSLLCCTGFVGLILGIVGIGRTRNGIRGGRWAAVSAIVVGAFATLLSLGAIVFFVWFGTSTVTLSSADVGQCVDVDELSGGNDATLFKKDCEESHEAEVVVADQFTSDQADAFSSGGPEAVCAYQLPPDYATAFATDQYRLGIVFEATEPDPGDDFVCYLERSDGKDLAEPIVD